jgi:hypothetical protein
MGLIKETNGATVSVASKNGYTKANVIKAKKYLKEIGSDRRNFPIERLVEMYNDVKGTNEKSVGCKPCQATKFYNGLQNYAYFGELTLINNGICTKDELDINKVVEEVKVEEPKEEEKKSDIKERMAKVRAAKGKKNDKD